MPSLEDACDNNMEYLVEGESLVSKLKRMTWNNKGRIIFILDATSTIRYVV